MKKVISAVLVATFMLGLVGCGSTTSSSTSTGSSTSSAGTADTGGLIGVAMPTQALQRWNQDGANMKQQLEAKGYTVDLQYANNDVNTQIQGIENMITKKCKVVVVAAIDGSALTDVLKKAGDNGVKVIAYGRLIMKTPNVDYYATSTKLDVILSPNDSLAIGIIASLKNAGYGTAAKPYPVLTGQDCDKPNVIAMINDQQSMSIFNKGYMKALNTSIKSGDIKIANEVWCKNWNEEEATKVTKDNIVDIVVKNNFHRVEDIYRNIPKVEWPKEN